MAPRRRPAANARVVRDVVHDGDRFGEMLFHAQRDEAALRLQGYGGGTNYGGTGADPENSFGGALAVGPQGFVSAATPITGGHVFLDPADNRIESGTASDVGAGPASHLFAARMARRQR